MPGRKIQDAHEARECLQAAAASKLSRAQWARQRGIDARSLNAWRLNLDRRRWKPTELRVLELVPTAAVRPATAAPLRVRCGPFVVEVGSEFNDEALARVLAVLASC